MNANDKAKKAALLQETLRARQKEKRPGKIRDAFEPACAVQNAGSRIPKATRWGPMNKGAVFQ
jgi:hypothetical protein